jgi:hypothetical protein
MTFLSEGIPEPGEERRHLSVKPQFEGTALQSNRVEPRELSLSSLA